jgi:hypothetical protein
MQVQESMLKKSQHDISGLLKRIKTLEERIKIMETNA